MRGSADARQGTSKPPNHAGTKASPVVLATLTLDRESAVELYMALVIALGGGWEDKGGKKGGGNPGARGK
jgi:hypothetical protein